MPLNSFKAHKKFINQKLENILENFTEILHFLKSKGSKFDEVFNLTFSKRRAIALVDDINQILKKLILIKYSRLELNRRTEENKEIFLQDLFNEYNKKI